MVRKTIRRLFLLTIALLTLSPALPAETPRRMQVVFLNPEYASEKTGFWPMFTGFMRAAADRLEIDLEVLHAERDHNQTVRQAMAVVSRSSPPDFLITGNEKRSAGPVIEEAERAGVKVFLVNNGFVDSEDLRRYGHPREYFPHWIGELIPDNFSAGKQEAQALIAQGIAGKFAAPGGKLTMAAFAGAFATHASTERVRGLQAAVAERREQVALAQIIPGDWSEETAARKGKLFFSNPSGERARLLWAANDATAFGLISAARAHDLKVGKDLLIGGCGWDSAAFQAVRAGRLATTVGGHFMDGAWALVLLHDYRHGLDFIDVPLRTEMKAVVPDNVDRFLPLIDPARWQSIDFRRFSRAHNPELKNYDFSPERVLRLIP